MKKIFSLLLLSIIAITSYGQGTPLKHGSTSDFVQERGIHGADSGIVVGVAPLTSPGKYPGQMRFKPDDSTHIYKWTGTQWLKQFDSTAIVFNFPSGFSVTGNPASGIDTITVSGNGNSGQYVTGTGALATFPTALPPTGAAGGVLNGTYPNPGIPTGAILEGMTSLSVKPAVAVVAVTNVTLSGEQTIDGQLTSSSIVLLTGQTAGAQNGFWVTSSGAWARPDWYTSTTQAPQFLTATVRLGTTYQGSNWRMTTAAVTIGTTATTWVRTPTNVNVAVGVLPAANGGVPPGGTTGQVIAKNSNANNDLTWTTIAGFNNPATQRSVQPGAGTDVYLTKSPSDSSITKVPFRDAMRSVASPLNYSDYGTVFARFDMNYLSESATAPGTSVNNWIDYVGNNTMTQATFANMPIYTTNGGPNNMPYINFSGGNKFLTKTSITINQPITLFAVVKNGTYTGGNAPLLQFGTTRGIYESPASSVNSLSFAMAANFIPSRIKNYYDTNWHVLSILMNGDTSNIWHNNDLPFFNPRTATTSNFTGISRNPGAGGGTLLSLGATSNSANFGIAELVVYNSALPTQSVDLIRAKMVNKYSLQKRQNVYCIGTSISCGSTPTNPWTEAWNIQATNYVNGNFYPLCLSGSTLVSYGLVQTNEINDPDAYVFIEEGTNDPAVNAAWYDMLSGQIRALIYEKRIKPSKIILVSPVYQFGASAPQKAKMLQEVAYFNQAVIDFGVRHSDSWTPTIGIDETADGTHPNTTGSNRMAANTIAQMSFGWFGFVILLIIFLVSKIRSRKVTL